MSDRIKNGSRVGFTLVELLVVIGIIALLISILLPTLGRARSAANAVKCLSNLRSIASLTQLYVNNNKGSLPPAEFHPTTGTGKNFAWDALLAVEMKVGDGQAGNNQPTADEMRRRGIFNCPDATLASNGVTGDRAYSAHPLLCPVMNTGVAAFDPYPVGHPLRPLYPNVKPYRLANVKRAAEIILFFDATVFMGANINQGYRAKVDGFNIDDTRFSSPNSPKTFLLTGYPQAAPEDMNNPIDPGTNKDPTVNYSVLASVASTDKQIGNFRFRHYGNGVCNALFADGHAGSFRYNAGQKTSDIKRSNIHLDGRP